MSSNFQGKLGKEGNKYQRICIYKDTKDMAGLEKFDVNRACWKVMFLETYCKYFL
jgi:hypothetical protein